MIRKVSEISEFGLGVFSNGEKFKISLFDSLSKKNKDYLCSQRYLNIERISRDKLGTTIIKLKDTINFKKYKNISLDIEFIVWDDSTLFSGWRSKKELTDLFAENTDYIESIGFIINENKSYLFLANSVDVDSYSQVIRIPKSQIVKRVKIDMDYKKEVDNYVSK